LYTRLYTRLYTVYEAPLAVISIRMSAYTKVRLYEPPLHRQLKIVIYL
jgi:hypothetical protein